MRFDGCLTINAYPDFLWASLWDSTTLRAWIPGCTRAEWRDSSHVEADVEQTLAMLSALFHFDLEVDARNHEEFRVRFLGTGVCKTLASSIDLDMSLSLDRNSEGSTEVRYDTELTMSGRLSSVGRFIVKAKTRELQRELKIRLEALASGGN